MTWNSQKYLQAVTVLHRIQETYNNNNYYYYYYYDYDYYDYNDYNYNYDYDYDYNYNYNYNYILRNHEDHTLNWVLSFFDRPTYLETTIKKINQN